MSTFAEMPEPVLVVEEDPRIRDVVIAVVEKEGHLAVAAQSDDEALRLLRDGLHPCLILVDGKHRATTSATVRAAESTDPRWAGIPTLVVSERENLDTLSRVLKAHCINNHRVA